MKSLPEDFELETATCLLKFSADWCGPCKAVVPVLEKVIENTGVTVYDIDIDADPETAQKFGVRSIPTVIAVRGGEVIDALVGASSQDVYEALANRVLK